MNWKLILQLSLFGLAMAIATVFWIPSTFEPLFWLLIFMVCARLIAKNVNGKYFLHGLMVGLANCVWVTSAHLIFFQTYMANHPAESAMMAKTPLPTSPQRMMAITGPIVGLLSGVVLGLFAVIAVMMLKKKPAKP